MNSMVLKDIELYYSDVIDLQEKIITISGSEVKHISMVMRHKEGDKLFITNGRGTLFETEIIEIKKELAVTRIISKKVFNNRSKDLIFCLPILRNPERMEFAIEKSVELGITNFFVYRGKRSVNKNIKLERLNKIAISAMKQSLRTFLPSVHFFADLNEILNQTGSNIVLMQDSNKTIRELTLKENEKAIFIFGPEGGFENSELRLFSETEFYKITDKRLRSETAVVSVASFLVNKGIV